MLSIFFLYKHRKLKITMIIFKCQKENQGHNYHKEKISIYGNPKHIAIARKHRWNLDNLPFLKNFGIAMEASSRGNVYVKQNGHWVIASGGYDAGGGVLDSARERGSAIGTTENYNERWVHNLFPLIIQRLYLHIAIISSNNRTKYNSN